MEWECHGAPAAEELVGPGGGERAMGGAQRPSVWSSSVTLQCRARAPRTPHAAGPAVTAVGSDGGGHQRVGVASGLVTTPGVGRGDSCNQILPGGQRGPAPPITHSASEALMKIRQRSLELLSISIHSILGITKSPS